MIFGKTIKQLYKNNLFVRQDDKGTAFYFDYTDFEGLRRTPFDFYGEDGHRLEGFFYSYGEPSKKRIIIFEHGMGIGHRAYMREIETIAKRGYTVYSYDHTGTRNSEGEGTRGFAQSLNDLNCCLNALKAHEELTGCTYSVIGHSWGGFSTLNISKFHPDITHRVAMSGFISPKQMLNQLFRGILSLYKKDLFSLELETNPDYANEDARENLKNATDKVLIIHSEDDAVCSIKYHFDIMEKELAGKDNLKFLRIRGKGHNPSYTESAVKYKDSYFADVTKRLKAGNLTTEEEKAAYVKSFDWYKMTEQDENFWQTVFDFLES